MLQDKYKLHLVVVPSIRLSLIYIYTVYKSSSLCFSFCTEASFEVLPRLWKIKFESGVLEEILFLGFPKERKLPSGLMSLEYEKAVQQSVYEQFRVVHEGKLRVLFRHDLKVKLPC